MMLRSAHVRRNVRSPLVPISMIPAHSTALSDLIDTHNPDLFCLTETWIKPTTTASELLNCTPPHYSLLSTPRNSFNKNSTIRSHYKKWRSGERVPPVEKVGGTLSPASPPHYTPVWCSPAIDRCLPLSQPASCRTVIRGALLPSLRFPLRSRSLACCGCDPFVCLIPPAQKRVRLAAVVNTNVKPRAGSRAGKSFFLSLKNVLCF